MDRSTLAAYDSDAAAFAKDWHEQPAPVDLQDIVAAVLHQGRRDRRHRLRVGREVAWLNANGYPASGFDASEGLLAEARRRYPDFTFVHAELPDLRGIATHSFDNVLCETVIMHLDRALIAPSVRRMLDIVKPGGIFYLSWRVTDDADQRDQYGRLYAAFDVLLVLAELSDVTLLLNEAVVSASSGKKIHRLVARKAR